MAKKDGTKLCKYCKTEIPAAAKVCPNCRKKQKGTLKWIILAIIIIIIIAALASSDKDDAVKKVNSNDNQTEAESQGLPKSDEELIFKVGETAEYNSVQVTLLNVSESSGSEFNKPANGNVFVLAEFEIANNSDKELNVSSIMMFEAYQDGYQTNLSIMAESEGDGKTLDGTVAPGKKMRGKIGYELPSDYKELEIYVKTDFWSNQKIKFLYEK